MEEKVINYKTNLLISAAIFLMHVFVLIIVPLVLLPQSVLWCLLLVPVLIFNITHWALIHEGVHKHLSPDSKANEYMSRGLAILMGASFHILKFGHLMHHKLNREWDCEIVKKDNLQGRVKHFWTLLGGLYVTEVLSTFAVAFVPKNVMLFLAGRTSFKGKPEILQASDRFFYQRGNAALTRSDAVMIILIYACSFLLYGKYWPVLAAFLAGRALVISFMDNIYHYDTATDNTEAGKDLALPKPLALLFLNGNYHETHHLNSDIPWRLLPVIQAKQQRKFNGGLVKHGLMQFKGPVVKQLTN